MSKPTLIVRLDKIRWDIWEQISELREFVLGFGYLRSYDNEYYNSVISDDIMLVKMSDLEFLQKEFEIESALFPNEIDLSTIENTYSEQGKEFAQKIITETKGRIR